MSAQHWLVTALVGAGLGTGCEPEIGTGTYYCGPAEFCPPSLACDQLTYTCVAPVLADPFLCPEESETWEPDDDLQTALASF